MVTPLLVSLYLAQKFDVPRAVKTNNKKKLFTDIVSKPYYDEEEIPPSETDSEDEIVLLRSDKEWKPVVVNEEE